MKLKMNIAELESLLDKDFAQVAMDFEIDELKAGEITVRLKISDKHLRPGGTVTGPSMFGLADVAFYLATLSLIGPKALTVTTNCSIDFMRKPAPGEMIAVARVLKLGKALSVSDVMLYSKNKPEPVAHANLTYSIPQQNRFECEIRMRYYNT